MGLTDTDHTDAYAYLRDLEAGVERAAPGGVSSGSIGYGAGGPVYLDDFRSKRPPTPSELVNAYKSVAFSCVDLNANAVAKVPLRLYARTGRGQMSPRFWETRRLGSAERGLLARRLESHQLTRGTVSGGDEIDEIVDHTNPLLQLLARPNPYFDGNQLIQHLARSLDVIGQAHWYPESLGPGYAPHELWPLHSQYCFPVKGVGNRIIDRWTYFADEIPFEALVWFRFISLRDPYAGGYAPLHACFEQLGLIGYYTATVESILKSGARPSAIVGPKDPKMPWSPEQAKRMETRINNKFSRGQQGDTLVVDGSFDFQPLTLPPADLAGQVISREARLVAANCFGVPITMLETESSNKATASEGSIQHQRNAIEPRCTLIGAALTAQLARRVDERLFFAFDNPVQEDKKANADVHKIYLDTKVLVPNEVRTELGYEPREGGDEPNAQDKPKPAAKPGKDEDE